MSGLAKLVASALSIPLGFIKEVGEHLETIEQAEPAPKPVKLTKEEQAEAAALLMAKRERTQR